MHHTVKKADVAQFASSVTALHIFCHHKQHILWKYIRRCRSREEVYPENRRIISNQWKMNLKERSEDFQPFLQAKTSEIDGLITAFIFTGDSIGSSWRAGRTRRNTCLKVESMHPPIRNWTNCEQILMVMNTCHPITNESCCIFTFWNLLTS